jgi:hypothetical protein
MKNILIGCGVVALLIIVLIVVGVVWIARTGMNIAKEIQVAAERLEATNQKFPFTEPADGLMLEDRLVSWIDLHKQAGQWEKEVENSFKEGGPNDKKGFSTFKEAINMIPNMMGKQVDSLEQARMSQKEYAWITGQVMGTLNSGDVRGDPAAANMIKAAENSINSPRGMPRQNAGMGMPQALAAPVTAAQIKHVLGLLKKHESDFLVAAPSIGFIDSMVSGFSNSARHQPSQLPEMPNPADTPAPEESPKPAVTPEAQPAS